MSERPRILIIGPTPPPFIGPSVNTSALLEHAGLHLRFEVLHLDTSDRRDITNIGRFDWTNVALACRHGAGFLAKFFLRHPALVYLPISPSLLGLIRDLQFLLPAVARGSVLVIHQRGGQMREFYRLANPALRAVMRYVFDHCDRVIVLGDYFRQEFEGLVPPERIAIVRNGVDPQPYLDWKRPAIRQAADAVRMVYLGNLVESKGYRLILEVARRLRGSRPPVQFLLAGEYSSEADREHTEEFLRQFGLHDSVRICGVVSGPKKIDLLCGADAFVFPTAYPYEGHPTVIVEAMAAALPIVSTKHVAIPETITDGCEGFLVERGDVDQLTARIRELAGDEQLRVRMGAQSRATMLERFTLDRCVDEIADVFAAALRDRGESPN
jgi:glycosyltransferase involved in cell wall biosynthesis